MAPVRRAYLPSLCTLVLVMASAPPPVDAWQTQLIGSHDVANDLVETIVVTDQGDAILAGRFDCRLTVAKLAARSGGVLWQQTPPFGGRSCGAPTGDGPVEPALVLDDGGGLVIARNGVAKLDAASGALLWHHGVELGEGSRFDAAAIDSMGNVLVGGYVATSDFGPEWDFLVVKLDGATGQVLWTQAVTGTPSPIPLDYESDTSLDRVLSITVDAADDVVAAGRIETLGEPRFAVVKLAGASGGVLWQDTGAAGEVAAVVVNQDGDVIAAGRDGGADILLRKLTGATGTAMWQRSILGDAAPTAAGRVSLALGPGGDPVVAGALAELDTGLDIAVIRLASEDGQERWRAIVTGSGPAPDVPRALAIAPAGDVLVAGTLAAEGDDGDLAAISLDVATGTVRWRRTVAGAAGAVDAGQAVAVDARGDVLVGGGTRAREADLDMTTVKLAAADGAPRWRRDLGGSNGGFDEGHAVAVTAGGDVVAAGYVFNGFGRINDFTVARLSGRTGVERWRQEINGFAFGFSPGNDQAVAVAVDADDDVAVAGTIADDGRSRAFAVVKLDGETGGEQWRVLIAGNSFGGQESARAVAFDAAGDVLAVGFLHNQHPRAFDPDLFVVKLDGNDGAELWRRIIPSQHRGEAFAVALDRTGDVVVAGRLSSAATGSDFIVLKLAGATGDEQWRRVVTGAATSSSAARALAVDAVGDVVAIGEVVDATTGGNVVVLKLDGQTGAETWRHTQTNGRFARDVGIDLLGHVVVLATLSEPDGTTTLRALELDGRSGAMRWARTLAHEINQHAGLAIDDAGDVVVTGATTGGALLIAKLGSDGGKERWRRSITGSAGGHGHGAAVAVDAAGDVAVVGQTTNLGSGFDFAVLKVRGDDGSDAVAAELRQCKGALRRAGAGILLGRLAALQRCRNAVNDGSLTSAAETCGDLAPTARAMMVAGTRARRLVATRCSDALLGELGACAGSVDAVVTADGREGCLVAANTAAADLMIAAAYGRTLAREEQGARSCQRAIGRASRRLAHRLIDAAASCDRAVDNGRVFDAAPCPDGAAGARRAVRPAIAAACDDARLGAIEPCAPTLDGLATLDGAGCLIGIHADAVRSAVAAPAR